MKNFLTKILIKNSPLFLSLMIASVVFLVPARAQAAVSFVGSCENSAISGADVTLTLPAMQQDDLVIVAYTVGDNDSVDFNMAMITADYTEVADVHAPTDTQDVELGVYWKVMGATPDSTAQVDGLGGTDAAVAAVCMVFRGVDTTTPMDVTPTTDALNNTMHPNPPSIDHNNPSGVWTVIAGASGHTLGATGTYTFPTGYTTNKLEDGEVDTSSGTVGMGYRSSGVSDPENPGVMTHSGTDSANFVWAAATMALRPAVAAAPTVTTQAETNVTESSATVNGNITATGGDNATVRGFAWGTNSLLSGGDTATTTESGSFGTGAFTGSLSSLTCNTTYYSRPYATNPTGTGYGTIDSFITSACSTPNLDQLHYRWRNDDGSESAATYAANEDTSLTTDLFTGDRKRLRFLISNTGSGSASNYTYRLEHSSSSCSVWQAVPTSSTLANEHWVMDLITSSSDGVSTTDSSGLTNPGGKTFVSGYLHTVLNQTGTITLTTSEFTELEFSIRSTNNVSAGTTYCFRLTNAGSITNFTYTEEPQASVSGITSRPVGGGQGAGGESGSGGGSAQGGGGQGGGGAGGGEGEGGGGGQGGGGAGGGGGDSGFLDGESNLAAAYTSLSETIMRTLDLIKDFRK